MRKNFWSSKAWDLRLGVLGCRIYGLGSGFLVLGLQVWVFRVKGIWLGQNNSDWVLVYGGFQKVEVSFYKSLYKGL